MARLDPAELGDQLGGRGGVVGEVLDLVEVLALLGGEGHRHAGVALRTGALGERLVGDLAHDVAAEPPPAAVELEDPVGRQLADVAGGELLLHRRGELLEGHRRAARPEHGGVVDHGPPRRRQLVEAGGDQGPQRTRQVGLRRRADRQGGELDEEQRVAAAALDEIVDEGVDRRRRRSPSRSSSRRTSVAASTSESGPSGTRRSNERSSRGGGQARSSSGRWLVISRNGRSASERTTTARRSRTIGSAHCRLSTHSTVIRVWAWLRIASVTHAGDPVADAGRVELVELGRMAEQVGDDTEQPLEQVVARLQRPQLLGALFDGAADVVGGGVGIEGEQRRQPVAQRRPQARLAVGRARRLEDDRLVGQRRDDVVGEARLAAARLADDRDHTAVAGAHERDRRLEQRQLVEAPDERDVAPHRAGAGGGRPGDDPRLFGLLAAADLGDAERLAGNRRRAQRLGGFADEHAARRRQSLEPRRRVDDVAHRGVVGAGHRADEHLAGVDADAHLDVADRVAVLDVLADETASVSCMRRAARTARSASSSWATGAPNRAMMASPRTLSTRPPNASISTTSGWKQDSTSRVTVSGSRCSASVV